MTSIATQPPVSRSFFSRRLAQRTAAPALTLALSLLAAPSPARACADNGGAQTFFIDPPGVPHGAAINTATCDFHGTTSPFSLTYAGFESSLIGPKGIPNLTIQDQVERHQVGGATVVIIQDGHITQHHWYGCRDRKAGSRTTSGTAYQAASLSKAVAAMGIVVADRLGQLNLAEGVDAIAGRFPGSLLEDWIDDKFKGAEASYPASITLRRLLSHTAGLDTHSIGAWDPVSVPQIRDVVMGSACWDGMYSGGVEPIYVPHTQYEYSGGGFIVAEHILELEQPLSFKEYLKQHVLDAAGLTLSTFDKAQTTMPNLVRGCSRSSCSYGIQQTNVKAAGGLLANARDYAELVVAVGKSGFTDSGHRVLLQSDLDAIRLPVSHERSTLDACATPGSTQSVQHLVYVGGIPTVITVTETCAAGKFREILLDGGAMYGLGISLSGGIETDGYPRILSHGGAQAGSRTWFKYDRRTGNGAVVMINGVDSWVDGDNTIYGADVLLGEIQAAYNATSW